jgi:hypothetical protein
VRSTDAERGWRNGRRRRWTRLREGDAPALLPRLLLSDAPSSLLSLVRRPASTEARAAAIRAHTGSAGPAHVVRRNASASLATAVAKEGHVWWQAT